MKAKKKNAGILSARAGIVPAVLMSASMMLGVASVRAAEAPQAAPTTQRSMQDITTDLQKTSNDIQQTLGGLPGMADAKHRAAVAPKAIPLIKKMLANFDELQAAQPAMKPRLASARKQYRAMLLVLGDKPTQKAVDAQANSNNPTEMIDGKSTQIMASWLTTGRDAIKQKPIVAKLEKLDTAHPDSDELTMFTAVLSNSAGSPELRDHLLSLATDTMKNPTAAKLKPEIAQMKAQQAQQEAAAGAMKKMEGKALVVTGKTVDGKSFTTADWKGKVILVDFWATWCPPCRAEIPQIVQMYKDHHAKGLEILGVSNDYNKNSLIEYTKSNSMPWPELFNPAAAADQQWNPITLSYGINGIPAQFLIDRKGILRSVTARQDMDTLIPKLLAE